MGEEVPEIERWGLGRKCRGRGRRGSARDGEWGGSAGDVDWGGSVGDVDWGGSVGDVEYRGGSVGDVDWGGWRKCWSGRGSAGDVDWGGSVGVGEEALEMWTGEEVSEWERKR